eukprot:COSAG05_NODE_4118_length_1666_cov_1.179962_2_plen_141_part_00
MKRETLILSKAIYKDMLDHANSLAPVESCGYLGGKDGEITVFYPMTNVDNSPEHFSFDPKEQFQVMKKARAASVDLLAVYHSHPASPARLSAEDIRLFNDPNPVYLIFSLKDDHPVLAGFKVEKPNDQCVKIKEVLLEVN